MNVVFQPHPGAQTRFMACTGRYALYGGAAGGGKSQCLLFDPFRQIQVESKRVASGDIPSSTGRCVFFRRTMPELREVMDRAHRYFPLIDPVMGAKGWNQNDKTWTFSCGYKYMFGQMEDDSDWIKYYGFEFTECVEVGTRVRMADGSLWPIEKIRPGDMVLTLEGPRAVSYLSEPRKKSCIRAVVRYRGQVLGEQVQPVTHPVLTTASATTTSIPSYSQGSAPETSSTLSWLSYESLLSARQENPAGFSWSAVDRTDYGSSGDLPPVALRLVTLTVPVVLHVPQPRSVARRPGADQFAATLHCGGAYVQQSTQAAGDFQGGYRAADDSYGGQLHRGELAAQSPFLQQAHAVVRSHLDPLADVHARAQGHSHAFQDTYVHPYTGEERRVSGGLLGDLVYGSCEMTPIGDRETIDITITGANHYITECGLINRNCLFDELTTFTEEQFDQLDTRVRSSDPVLKNMLYVRAGTNPVGAGLEWVRRRFVEIAPPNTRVIVNVPIKVIDQGIERVVEVKREQIFIPARIEDNPSIDQAEYAATLATKPPAVRRALRDGDWNVSADAFFADLWDPAIHICKPFKIPAGWYKFRSCDYGYAYPGMSSIQWWAVDPDGNMVCYRSYTCTGRNSRELAEDIAIIERDNGEWDTRRDCSLLTGPMDSSCWGDAGHVGPTIAETMMEMGVHWFKCTKDRKGMADQMRIRLKKRSPHPAVTDKDGKPAWIVPGIRWFDTCTSKVRTPGGKRIKVGPIVTIPVLPSDPDDPEKWDTKANDHDGDSAGYACMSRPIMGIDEKKDPGNGGQAGWEARLWDDDELAPRRANKRMGNRGAW